MDAKEVFEFGYCPFCDKPIEVYKSVFGDFCSRCLRGIDLTNFGKFYGVFSNE